MLRNIFKILFVVVFAGCSSGGGVDDAVQSLQPENKSITVVQNSRKTVDLASSGATSVIVTQQPDHGVVTIQGMIATYRVTEPLFTGSDRFKFKLASGGVSSTEASVDVTVTPVTAGAHTFTENYTAGAFDLTGWTNHSSSFGHTVNTVVGFDSATHNSVVMPSRRFGIYGDIGSFAGDASYNSLFSVLPVDGAGGAMKDWPWKADLIHLPQCGVDATVVAKVVSNGGQNPMGAILLNYDIESNSSGATELTGYQILFNGGGGSLTLSRFKNAHETATAFLDRWPNTTYGNEAMANPVERGPYKGWNYKNGVWPAGGNVGVGSNWTLAARYQYNSTSKVTTISYEARAINGTDSTPGVWDLEVVLSGADSLPPGGSFGIMGLNYHTDTSILTTDFEVVDYKVVCAL